MKHHNKFPLVLALLGLLGLLAYSEGTCPSGDIRLCQVPTLSSPDKNVGRVDVCCDDKWGTISLQDSRNFWSEKNIQVACIQLGFSGGLNSIPPINISKVSELSSDMPVHFIKVGCNGGETRVADCAKEATDSTSHDKDVFIVCRPKRLSYSGVHVAKQQVGDFRLFGNGENGVGAVSVLTSLGWSGVCPDSSWTVSVARVFCLALGYDVGQPETFEYNGSSISLSDAQCSDTLPANLSRIYTKHCSFSRENCTAKTNLFAGIRCNSLASSRMNTVRLFGIGLFMKDRVLGVVEVFEDNKWGMVCSHRPSGSAAGLNARVLCTTVFRVSYDEARSVGLPLSSLRKYESNLKPLWVDDILCPRNASLFSDCQFKEPVGFSNCSGREILAVDCGSKPIGREGNTSSIIIGIMVMVFLFVVLTLIIIKWLYTSVRKHSSLAVTSFPMSTMSESQDAAHASDGINAVNHLQEIGNEIDVKLAAGSNKLDGDSPEDSGKLCIGAVGNGCEHSI